jgi:hypothetical protein
MNKKALRAKIEKPTVAAFRKALKEIGEEQLCGFALYTDESALSLGISINTVDHLNKVTKREPDHRIGYQWSPPE